MSPTTNIIPGRSLPDGYRPFTLILSGGGARGFAHMGVLRALEADGYRPSAVVGVSMGAVVGTTYALRQDWYRALLHLDTRVLPDPLYVAPDLRQSFRVRVRNGVRRIQALYDMTFGWGVGFRSAARGQSMLQELTGGRSLNDGRIPLAVSATDLASGRRHVMRTGNAAEAIYASIALAGILPPLPRGRRLLADGAYADIAPVDVARAFGNPVVIAVDPGQALASARIRHGYQALIRAMEVCQLRHADARFAQADMVLCPDFRRLIGTLDFDARRECIAAGIRAVRRNREPLKWLLTAPLEHQQAFFPNSKKAVTPHTRRISRGIKAINQETDTWNG